MTVQARLTAPKLHEIVMLATRLRACVVRGDGDATAQGQCVCLYDRLRSATGGPGCALVRIYRTRRFADLDPAQQASALQAARAHGGQVEVCSRAGEGTVFTVRLPYGEGR